MGSDDDSREEVELAPVALVVGDGDAQVGPIMFYVRWPQEAKQAWRAAFGRSRGVVMVAVERGAGRAGWLGGMHLCSACGEDGKFGARRGAHSPPAPQP